MMMLGIRRERVRACVRACVRAAAAGDQLDAPESEQRAAPNWPMRLCGECPGVVGV
jgi:hypothetical protein